MLSLNVWFRADSPPSRETDTSRVYACLFPRRFLFRAFGRMTRTAYATAWLSVSVWNSLLVLRRWSSHVHTFVWEFGVWLCVCTRIQKRLREKWSDAQSKMPWLAISIKSRHQTNRRYIQSLIPSSNSYPNKMNSFTAVSCKFYISCVLSTNGLHRKAIENKDRKNESEEKFKNQWKEQRTIVDR